MSVPEDPVDPENDVKSWASARDRIIRFASNIVTIERTVDRLVTNQAAQQKLLNSLNSRVQTIEAQQEVIIRLLERGRRD